MRGGVGVHINIDGGKKTIRGEWECSQSGEGGKVGGKVNICKTDYGANVGLGV